MIKVLQRPEPSSQQKPQHSLRENYDLHTHSYFSDGTLSPEQLVLKAHQQGVTTLALTDHDTIAGVSLAQRAAELLVVGESDNEATTQMTIIAGIEFSCLWRKRMIHVLGLGVDTQSAVLLAATTHQSDIRRNRGEAIAAKLSRLGITGSLEGASRYAEKGVITRPHFAQYLLDSGHVKTIAEAFKRYLGDGGPADVKVEWPSLETVCQWVQQAGGTAVLAHPDKYNLTRTKLIELLEDFKQAGGRAIEVISGQQDKSVTDKLAQIANKMGLLASCGSDFHRPENAWQALGRSSRLPESCQPIWQLW